MSVVKIENTFHSLPLLNEKTIRNFVYNYGPAVSVINCAQLQFYRKGVIRCDHPNCNPNLLNHAVTVVGYGVEQATTTIRTKGNLSSIGTPYWLVKNGWGRNWGEQDSIFDGSKFVTARYTEQTSYHSNYPKVTASLELSADYLDEINDQYDQRVGLGEYLCPPIPFFTYPIGPWSICYWIYFVYTRIIKVIDWFCTKELVEFLKGVLKEYALQHYYWAMNYQIVNFTVSMYKDKWVKLWSRIAENFFVGRIRKRNRIFDLFSNLSYIAIGKDLHGKWYNDDRETRMQLLSPVISMLWNKEDLNMTLLEYWVHKLTIQPLKPGAAVWERFEMFRKFFNKSYDPKEFFQRMTVFAHNLEVIFQLNKNEKGTAVYGVTMYADRTSEEFAQKFGAYDPVKDTLFGYMNDDDIPPIADYVPDTFDWRYFLRNVNSPKDYRDCPAAWAYTVVENIETLYAIKTGRQNPILVGTEIIPKEPSAQAAHKTNHARLIPSKGLRATPSGEYKTEYDDSPGLGEYLYFTIPIGPASLCYNLYFWYTRLLKLWAALSSEEGLKELAAFFEDVLKRYSLQHYNWAMSYQIFNLSESIIEDKFIKVWSRIIENYYSSKMRKRHRIFDFFSNMSYIISGKDLYGKWYNDDLTTRSQLLWPVVTMLWNKEDLNMTFIEYWINKLTVQPLRPRGALWNRFELFQKFYNKSYDTKELYDRMSIFAQNLEIILQLNKNEQGTGVYGVTMYADRTLEEFAQTFGAYDTARDAKFGYVNDDIRPIADRIPAMFDWRSFLRIVTNPKDYRNCPAAWAYAVVENIETLYAIRTGTQVQFSDQQVIDCDQKSMGCLNGSVASAYQYIYMAGLTSKDNYTYKGYQEECHYEPSMSLVEIQRGFKYIFPDEEKIRNYVYSYGPVIARINIGPLQFYKKGIIRCTMSLCDPRVQNHVVNLYGYGILTKQAGKGITPMPYWIAKNYWSRHWGEEGFFRFYRGENMIGVRNFVTAPSLT